MNQKGFATLEVILMIVVIGILATVAVPRFTDMTTKANTAKIQSDLATLDNAISIYFMEKGTYPTQLSDLSDYVKDIENVKPPTGRAYIDGTATDIKGKNYAITAGSNNEESRATLDSNTLGKFSITKTSTSN